MNKLWFDIPKPSPQGNEWYKRLPIHLLSGLIILNMWVAITLCANAQSTPQAIKQTKELGTRSAVAVSLPPSLLTDGIHLFGRAQVPEQLQTEYLIFKMNRSQVIGAFFMPSSSFDCFAGTLEAGKLNLTVVESYEQQSYEHSVNLNQYYAIKQISNNDLRILDVCAVHAGSGHTVQEP